MYTWSRENQMLRSQIQDKTAEKKEGFRRKKFREMP